MPLPRKSWTPRSTSIPDRQWPSGRTPRRGARTPRKPNKGMRLPVGLRSKTSLRISIPLLQCPLPNTRLIGRFPQPIAIAGQLQRPAACPRAGVMFRNLRYAVRMLRRNPGFAAIAIVSLALGIGVNAAMFSFADALVLRPLPVVHPGEVVTLSGTAPDIPGTGFGSLSYPDYLDFRDHARLLDGLTAIVATPVGVAADSKALPKLRLAMMVSGNFFETMKISTALGRIFTPDEDRVRGRDAVAVLGHDFWEKQ